MVLNPPGLYRESVIFYGESAGCVCGKVWFSMFLRYVFDVWAFGPITKPRASSVHTNFPIRIDPHHPEPPSQFLKFCFFLKIGPSPESC